MAKMDDLTPFFSSKKASVPDLDWLVLDIDEYHDQQVYPMQNLDMLPDLEALWSSSDDPGGDVARLNPVNKAMSQQAVTPFWSERGQTGYVEDPEMLKESVILDLRTMIQEGVPISDALRDLTGHYSKETLTASAPVLRDVLSQERGLLGHVYIDSNILDSCADPHTDIPSYPSKVAFVLGKKACRDCVKAQGGVCSVLKRTLVFNTSEIPFEEMQGHYEGLAKQANKDLSGLTPEMPPKTRIRMANLAPTREEVYTPSPKPLDRSSTVPDISFSKAKAALSEGPLKQGQAGSLKTSLDSVQTLRLRILNGDRGIDIADKISTIPQFAHLRSDFSLLGRVYADLSLFNGDRKAAKEWFHAHPEVVPTRGPLTPKAQHWGRICKATAQRATKLGYTQTRIASKLSTPKATVESLAEVWSQEIQADVANYVVSGPNTKAASGSEVTLADAENLLKQERDTPPVLAGSGWRVACKESKEGAQLLRLLIATFGAGDVKTIWFGDRTATASAGLHNQFQSITKHYATEKAQARIIETLKSYEVPETPPFVIASGLLEGRIAKWLRDEIREGVTATQLRDKALSTLNATQVVTEAPVILAMMHEAGLLSRAYAHSAAFKDCKRGAKAVAPSVTQVVASSKCTGCRFNLQGRCGIYKNPLVQVPTYNETTLKAALLWTGKSASTQGGDYRSRVLSANLDRPSSGTQVYSDGVLSGYYTQGATATSESDAFEVLAMLKQAKDLSTDGMEPPAIRVSLEESFGPAIVKAGSTQLEQVLERAQVHAYVEELEGSSLHARNATQDLVDFEVSGTPLSVDLEDHTQPSTAISFTGFTEE